MMESKNQWKEYKLSEITDLISRGITPSYTEDNSIGVIVLNQKCIRDNRINFEPSRLTNSQKKKITESKILKKGDILVNSTGVGTLGRVAQFNGDSKIITVDSHITIVRPNDLVDSKFLGYNLFMNQRYIEHLGEGSTGQTELSRVRLGEAFKVKLPSLEEQKTIAKILSDLDEKIETNNKINKNLEEMAQAIFKQWFIDFEFPNEEGKPYKSSGGEMVESELGMIPKGWSINELNDIILNSKKSIKSENLQDKIKYVPIDSMTMKSIILNNYKAKDEAKSSLILFDKFDILIGAMRVYFHRVNLALFDGVTRTTTFVLKSIKKEEREFNLFLLNLENTIAYAEKTSKGTTMPYAVWENGLASMKFINPTSELKLLYSNKVKKNIEEIERRLLENERLEKLRGTLLPKLMSGEVRVPLEDIEN